MTLEVLSVLKYTSVCLTHISLFNTHHLCTSLSQRTDCGLSHCLNNALKHYLIIIIKYPKYTKNI